MSEGTPTVRLVLVDDWELVRVGLRDLLKGRPHWDIVGEAGSRAEARAVIERVKPDVALIDIEMPDGSGLDLCGELHEQHPELHSIIVTMHDKPNYIRRALGAGAHGYVLKDWPAPRILAAIETVAAGKLMFPPIPESVLWDFLTSRERQVARPIARGYSNAQVGALLGIMESTVVTHRANAYKKLQCYSPVEIADYMRNNGISECDDVEPRSSRRPPAK
jgi:DNA-binding NarL/FixJ family response regulator